MDLILGCLKCYPLNRLGVRAVQVPPLETLVLDVKKMHGSPNGLSKHCFEEHIVKKTGNEQMETAHVMI